MLRIRPYLPCDGDAIVPWAETPFEFKQWSGTRYDHYPITGDDMNAYYGDNPDMWPFTAFDDEGPVGHFIVMYEDEEQKEVEIGFVIVDPKKRGEGRGAEIMRMAARFAFEFLGAEKAGLKVFDNNEQARRCYEAVGFRVVPQDPELSFDILGERWGCLVMELEKPAD